MASDGFADVAEAFQDQPTAVVAEMTGEKRGRFRLGRDLRRECERKVRTCYTRSLYTVYSHHPVNMATEVD